MIETRGTDTTNGFYPHVELCTDDGLIRCPVAVHPRRFKMNEAPRVARNGHGQLLYVLPGGERTVL